MKKRINSIEKFEKQVLNIEERHLDIQNTCEEVVRLSSKFLSEKKIEIIASGFDSIEEEIKFFKNDKQVVLTSLLYYSEVYEINSKLSLLTDDYKQNFLNEKIGVINKFFLKHFEFIQYVETGRNYLDEFYFTRGHLDYLICKNQELEILDLNFNTPKDRLLAKIMANKKILSFLQNEQKFSKKVLTNSNKNIKWTSSKTSLAELIYALHSARVINNGNIGIKQITQALQSTFNIKVGDVYRIYNEIRSRKKSKAKFLNELESAILNSMDSLEV